MNFNLPNFNDNTVERILPFESDFISEVLYKYLFEGKDQKDIDQEYMNSHTVETGALSYRVIEHFNLLSPDGNDTNKGLFNGMPKDFVINKLLISGNAKAKKLADALSNNESQVDENCIETFKSYYLNHLHEYIETCANSVLLRNKFKEEIPLESIKDMDIEDYVMGDGKSSGFCYDLEKGKWRYAGPGIGGQNVSKFGISKHDGKYVTDKHMDVIENPDEFWENFKNQLYSFLKEYETLEEPIHAIDKYPLLKNMGMVITKLLYIYYPEKFINISTKQALSFLMRYFGYDFNKQMGGDELSFMLARNLKNDIPELVENDPVYIGEALWNFMQEMIEEETEETEEENVETIYPDYDKNKFLSEVFMDETEYNKLYQLLTRKKNIILKGSPGVGKTFMAKKFAYSIIGKEAKNQILSVQFHQSYSYEDFIEGIRPDKDNEGKFSVVPGVFKEFVDKAKKDRSKNYYVIIDEINRGNLSKILGELMKLIEYDKRDKEDVILPYSKEEFIVPENIYIIGTMNTADRSLAMVDYALRRRFAFYHVSPAFGKTEFKKWLIEKNEISETKVNELCTKMNNINLKIRTDLGKGFEIGHSYFVDTLNDSEFDTLYTNIIEYEIAPLVEEYWFDDDAKVKEYLDIIK